LAVPLYSHGTDEVTGVMRTTININAVLEILSADILGGSGQADLYLPDNQVLDPEYPTGLVSADPEALSRLQTLIESNSAETMVYEGLPGILSAASVTSSKAEGEGAIRNLGWTVVVHQDQAASLAPIQAQTRSTILIAVAILALGAAAAMYVAQTLSGPITRLTAIAEKIGAGDNSAQAIVETEDEIGTLAQTFNSMTSQLREFIATLEQRVADRTMELEAAQKQMVRRASELATVAEVGTVSSSVLEVKQLLQTVVELSKERFNLYHAHVYLMDEAGENLVLTAGAGEPGRIMSEEKRSIPLSREQSLVARAARERKGVIVNDVTQAPDFLPNPLLPETRSELAVPLIVGGKVLGVFDVQSNQVGRFSEVDVDIQSTLASQTAVALQNARQFAARQQAEEAVARRAAELATVARVSSAAATVLESEQLLHEVVELTKQEFKLYHSHVYLLNEAGDTLVLAAGSGEPGRRMAAEKRSIPLNQERSLVARAAREKQGVIANDVRSESDFLPNPFLPETRSELAVPLLVGDRVLGVFDVQSDQVNRFTNEDVNIQSTLASQIAIAMQNARAFTQAQRQAEREATLNLIGQKIQSTVTVEAALQVAARELGRALGAPLTIAQLGLKSDQGNSN
jgi:GAF domain-containing protein/HAMP domain-containing protein